MNIDFNAAFEGGMSREDIEEMFKRQMDMAEQQYAEKLAAKRAAEEAKKEQAQKASAKEELKAEARAHAINAIIAYSEAFDLLQEDDVWDEEAIAKAEDMLKKVEETIPLYIKIIQLQDQMDNDFGDESLGLGGPFFGLL